MIDKFTGKHFFLSNFYDPAPVVFEGLSYRTTEHAYQAAKVLDVEERRRIQEAATPGIAKKLGRTVTLREDWDAVKDEVMLYLCRQKFQEPTLRRQLLATGFRKLVEGNHWGDVYWGVCKGVGKNRLGETLMRIRDEIRKDMENG